MVWAIGVVMVVFELSFEPKLRVKEKKVLLLTYVLNTGMNNSNIKPIYFQDFKFSNKYILYYWVRNNWNTYYYYNIGRIEW